MTLSLGALLVRRVRAARRAGVHWSDSLVPPRPARPAPKTPPEMALTATGGVALLLTLRLGLDVGPTVLSTLGVVATAVVAPFLWRRWQRSTTKGRHAAY